jgi:hypothetical protein
LLAILKFNLVARKLDEPRSASTTTTLSSSHGVS